MGKCSFLVNHLKSYFFERLHCFWISWDKWGCVEPCRVLSNMTTYSCQINQCIDCGYRTYIYAKQNIQWRRHHVFDNVVRSYSEEVYYSMFNISKRNTATTLNTTYTSKQVERWYFIEKSLYLIRLSLCSYVLKEQSLHKLLVKCT